MKILDAVFNSSKMPEESKAKVYEPNFWEFRAKFGDTYYGMYEAYMDRTMTPEDYHYFEENFLVTNQLLSYLAMRLIKLLEKQCTPIK